MKFMLGWDGMERDGTGWDARWETRDQVKVIKKLNVQWNSTKIIQI